MKYLEELKPGDCFINNKNQKFLLTSDYKNNNDRLCFSLNNGYPAWMNSQEVVEPLILYTIDQDSNIITIKE
jgi:hypothetical protein